jgi:hypothetical protein
VYDDDTLDEVWPQPRRYGTPYWLVPEALRSGTVPVERR